VSLYAHNGVSLRVDFFSRATRDGRLLLRVGDVEILRRACNESVNVGAVVTSRAFRDRERGPEIQMSLFGDSIDTPIDPSCDCWLV